MKSKTQRLLSWSVFRMTIAAEMWASVLLPAWVEPVQSKKHLKTQSSGFVLTCKKPCQSRVGVENAHHPNSYCTQIVAIAQVGDPRSIPKPWPTEPTEDWQNAEKQHVKKKANRTNHLDFLVTETSEIIWVAGPPTIQKRSTNWSVVLQSLIVLTCTYFPWYSIEMYWAWFSWQRKLVMGCAWSLIPGKKLRFSGM